MKMLNKSLRCVVRWSSSRHRQRHLTRKSALIVRQSLHFQLFISCAGIPSMIIAVLIQKLSMVEDVALNASLNSKKFKRLACNFKSKQEQLQSHLLMSLSKHKSNLK